MNTTKLIKALQQQNQQEKFQEKKEEILQYIKSMITSYEFKKKRVIRNRDKAIGEIAQKMLNEHPNYAFNPYLCSILEDIVLDCKERGGCNPH